MGATHETLPAVLGTREAIAPAVDVIASIGRTPLQALALPDLEPGAVVWGKCEWFNPGGSVKDRTALSLITEGERSGRLRPGKTIVDSSSGNTAVGLALVGRAKGYPVELYMPANVIEHRKRRCREYGARLVETDPLLGSDGAIVAVRAAVAAQPDRYFYTDQYRNPANPLAHYRTTGPEIWAQTEGTITHFVAGLGTTGTVMGTGRYLRERNPRVRIVAVEPDEPFHGLEGLKHLASALVPEIYEPAGHDEKVTVGTDDAYALARQLRGSGLRLGNSAAAAVWAAREIARRDPRARIVVLLPDAGEVEAAG